MKQSQECAKKWKYWNVKKVLDFFRIICPPMLNYRGSQKSIAPNHFFKFVLEHVFLKKRFGAIDSWEPKTIFTIPSNRSPLYNSKIFQKWISILWTIWRVLWIAGWSRGQRRISRRVKNGKDYGRLDKYQLR